MKSNLRLKMIYRCFMQSWTIILICWSNTPSTWSNNTTTMQKKILRPRAKRKHCFLLQFVKKKVSIPSFKVQIIIMLRVQKESKDQCLQTSPITILNATNTTKLVVVINTRDSSLAKGYYLTFPYSILITLIQACVLVLFFLFFGYRGACSSGGRKRTAPLGKKRKLGILFLMSCMPTVTSSKRTASSIMLNQFNYKRNAIYNKCCQTIISTVCLNNLMINIPISSDFYYCLMGGFEKRRFIIFNTIMQQNSGTQFRFERRVDAQRLKNKYRTPSFYTHQRLKTNPQQERKESIKPGKLYLRSIDTDKHQNYNTIDTTREQHALTNRYHLNGLKGFERLPQIKQNKPQHNLSQLYNQSRQKTPTISSLLKREGKSKNMRSHHNQRAYSVNNLLLQEKAKKRHTKKYENYSESNINDNAVKKYLVSEYKARYPSTQVKNYLARMKLRQVETQEKQVEDDHNYYQTFFSKQPQFYKVRTEYALELSVTKQIQNSRFTLHSPVALPAIPSRQRIAQFIESYVSFSKDVNMDKLMKEHNFLVEYSPSEMYFGEMVTNINQSGNIKNGIGILLTKTSCYQGLFQNNEKAKGFEVNPSGIYRGQYKNNKKQGTGQFQWTNGQYYIGDWREGQRHGTGIWTNKNGDSYNGEWYKGRTQGTGIYISQGREYQGDFIDFKKDGWGKQKFPNEDIYEGGFKDGLPHGKGIYVWCNGTRYEGEFSIGFRNGKGLLSTMDGFIYNGQFIDQKPQGLCEIYMPNGDIYQGYLRNGKKNGRGVLMMKQSGRNLEGLWQNDLFISEIK